MTQLAPTTDSSQASDHEPAWWNPWYWPGGTWALVIGLAILLTPFGIRTIRLSGIPAIPEPFDVAEFGKDLPEDENAFTEYRRASGMRARLVAATDPEKIKEPDSCLAVLEKGWAAADDPMRDWLDLHRETMLVWRQGTERQQGLNMPPTRLALDVVLATIQDQRLFVRLAVAEAYRLMAEGQHDEALKWARAAFRCGGHTSHRGCLIQGMVGTACHSMSAAAIVRWAQQPEVTSDQIQQARKSIRDDYALYESRSNLVKADYLAFQNTLSTRSWLQVTGPATTVNTNSSEIAAVMRLGYWVIGEPELTSRMLRQILANQIREIDKPLTNRRPLAGSGTIMLFDPDPATPLQSGQLDAAAIDRIVSRSSLLRVMVPSIKKFDTVLLRQDARQAALEVVLALQAYRRDHGPFPEDVKELVPEYLPSVPADPLDPKGAPIRYRRDELLKAVVWSVGDDNADGGGDLGTVDKPGSDVGWVVESGK